MFYIVVTGFYFNISAVYIEITEEYARERKYLSESALRRMLNAKGFNMSQTTVNNHLKKMVLTLNPTPTPTDDHVANEDVANDDNDDNDVIALVNVVNGQASEIAIRRNLTFFNVENNMMASASDEDDDDDDDEDDGDYCKAQGKESTISTSNSLKSYSGGKDSHNHRICPQDIICFYRAEYVMIHFLFDVLMLFYYFFLLITYSEQMQSDAEIIIVVEGNLLYMLYCLKKSIDKIINKKWHIYTVCYVMLC